jgi:hypothetical protein
VPAGLLPVNGRFDDVSRMLRQEQFRVSILLATACP